MEKRIIFTLLQFVLIVPLWNWNTVISFVEIFGRFVLIVPLWNWNRSYRSTVAEWPCFNRTFMELKWIIATWYQQDKHVLIVPLWNWNLEHVVLVGLVVRFNRTFMELKCGKAVSLSDGSIVLIVPLWNWNSESGEEPSDDTESFNRTFMELKYTFFALSGVSKSF